jgi:hypothetical protein
MFGRRAEERHEELLALLCRILRIVRQVNRKEDVELANIDDLVTAVAAQGDEITSLEAFIQGLKDQILAAGSDPLKVQAVFDTLESNTARIHAAIVTPGPTP